LGDVLACCVQVGKVKSLHMVLRALVPDGAWNNIAMHDSRPCSRRVRMTIS